MRKSLLVAALMLGSTLASQPQTQAAIPTLAPKRAVDGGTYNGTAGTGKAGYPDSVKAILANRGGITIPSRPEYLHEGRVYSATDPRGFSNTNDVAPRPVFQLTTHPVTDSRFNSDQILGFENYVAAADGLDLNGDVWVGCEGNFVHIPAPAPGLVQAWGAPRIIGMHMAKLLASGFNQGDEADVYAWSNSAFLGTTKVIGPFRFAFKAAADATPVFDANATVSPGNNGTFNDWPSLINYFASTSDLYTKAAGKTVHVDVKVADNTTINFSQITFADNSAVANSASRRGRFQIVGGANFKMANSTFANMDFMFGAVDITNCTVDVANLAQWMPKSAGAYHMGTDTAVDFSSSQGVGETPGSFGIGSKAKRQVAIFGIGLLPRALMACRIKDCSPLDLYIPTAVGCVFDNLSFDVGDVPGSTTDNLAPLPYLSAVNSFARISGAVFNNPTTALNLAYTDPTGAGRAATYSTVGSSQNPQPSMMVGLIYTGAGAGTYDVTGSHGNRVPGEGGRTLTLRKNGAVQQGFTFGQSATGPTIGKIYTFGDLLAAVNAWSQSNNAGWLAVPSLTGASGLTTWTAAQLAMTSATFTAPAVTNSDALTINGDIVGQVSVGQVLFTTDGRELPAIKALGTSTGGAGIVTLASKVTIPASSLCATSLTGAYTALFSKASSMTIVGLANWVGKPAGSLMGLAVSSITATVSGAAITLKQDASANPPAIGQTLFDASGTPLGFITAVKSGTGGIGSVYALSATPGNRTDAPLYVSTSITYYDARTFVLNVAGVPVKSFAAAPYPALPDNDNVYYIDDPVLPYKVNGIGPGVVSGLVTAINNFGNGWSATSDAGSRLPAFNLYGGPSSGPAGGTIFGQTNNTSVAQYYGISVSVSPVASSDTHVDNGQSGNGNIDNAIMSNAFTTMGMVQTPIWGSPPAPKVANLANGASWALKSNIAMVNWCAQNTNDDVNVKLIVSSLQESYVHVLISSNSLPGFQLHVRGGLRPLNDNTSSLSMDATCRITNNVLNHLLFSNMGTNAQGSFVEVYTGPPPTMQAQVRRNAINAYYSSNYSFNVVAAGQTNSQFADNYFINGTITSGTINLLDRDLGDFPKLGNGTYADGSSQAANPFMPVDFIPAVGGKLRLNLRKPDVAVDAFGKMRAVTALGDMPGAASLLAA